MWAAALALTTLGLLSGTPLIAAVTTLRTAHAMPLCSSTVTGSSGPSEPPTLAASVKHVGCIGLLVRGAVGTPITITEVLPGSAAGTRIAVVTPSSGEGPFVGSIAWRCDRLTRIFQATETLPDGSQQSASTSVRTPSCAGRISTSLPALRLHSGYPATIALADRWKLGGLRVRACLSDSAPHRCSAVTLKPGSHPTLLRLMPRAAGHPLLEISDPYEHVRYRLHVLSGRPVLLATGDSEMQVLDDDLASDLSRSGGTRVIGDARQSTAISSPFFFNWPAHAVSQVDDDRPDIVAMFLGGNEGFRLGSADCCGVGWSRAYAVRVAEMMRRYLQHGAATVYWFLIPTPSREPFVRVVRAVNRGIILAAAQFHHGVHVFDLRPVFSPGGRYVDSLTHDGRTITVHESDGFHLSASSDLIVAQMFIERLRKEGILP